MHYIHALVIRADTHQNDATSQLKNLRRSGATQQHSINRVVFSGAVLLHLLTIQTQTTLHRMLGIET